MFIFRIISLWNLKREANTLTQMLNLFCRRLPLIISKKKHKHIVVVGAVIELYAAIFAHFLSFAVCVFFIKF